jgi:hypothetical protein
VPPEASDGSIGGERVRGFYGREHVERLIQRAEVALRGEGMHSVACEEQVDPRLAERQTRDDARRERQRAFELVVAGRSDVGVHDESDPREVLLLVLAHHRRAVAGPRARVQVAHRIAGAIGTDAQQVGGVPRPRGAGRPAQLVTGVAAHRERGHSRDLRDHDEARARRPHGSPLREPERQERGRAQRVDVVLAARDEARVDYGARAPARRQPGQRRLRALPPAVPRQPRPLDPDVAMLGRAVVAKGERERDLLPDGHPAGAAHVDADAFEAVSGRQQDRGQEKGRQREDEQVRLGAPHVDGEDRRETDGHEDDAPLAREPRDHPEQGTRATGQSAVAPAIALGLRRRDEYVVEALEVASHTGIRRLCSTSRTTPSAPRPP